LIVNNIQNDYVHFPDKTSNNILLHIHVLFISVSCLIAFKMSSGMLSRKYSRCDPKKNSISLFNQNDLDVVKIMKKNFSLKSFHNKVFVNSLHKYCNRSKAA